MRVSCFLLTGLLQLHSVASADEPVKSPARVLAETVVLISRGTPGPEHAVGTGFLVSDDGLVVTAGHVALDKDNNPEKNLWSRRRIAEAQREDTKVVIVKVPGPTGNGRDIALLRMDPKPKTPLPYLRRRPPPRAGAEVLIAGFPLVFDKPYDRLLLRRGIVASTDFSAAGGSILVPDLDAVEGFSGGPVVDVSPSSSFGVVGVVRGDAKPHPETHSGVAEILRDSDLIPD